ncbi:MAG: AMP-binding protein [Pseudomonadota bacterium]
MRCKAAYRFWQDDPVAFGDNGAKSIDWFNFAIQVFDPDFSAFGRWFDGVTSDTCHNWVDQHPVTGQGDTLAHIHNNPETQTVAGYSFSELQMEFCAPGYVLRDFGVEKGDRVVNYVPTGPQTVLAKLGCARLGAIDSVGFGGRAADALTQLATAKTEAAVSAKTVVPMEGWPKTESGTVLRGIKQKIANGSDDRPPAAIEGLSALGEITNALIARDIVG